MNGCGSAGRPVTDDSDSPEPTPKRARIASRNGERAKPAQTMNGYQRGAILRVKVKNFVTYESVEFRPGPQLNMVIGPNGTGKSSLVCAICLGLGFSPHVLGRATNVNEFVKHGCDAANIEIELADSPSNHVIGVTINRSKNGMKWTINGNQATQKAVRELVNRLRIQIDNLCQFLPQDRVNQFAALSPTQLLIETLRATASKEINHLHDELAAQYKELRAEENRVGQKNAELDALVKKQQADEHHMEALKRLEELEARKQQLKLQKYSKEYSVARNKHSRARKDLLHATQVLQQLKQKSEPLLRSINLKQEYKTAIEEALSSRERAVVQMNRDADTACYQAAGFEQQVSELEARVKAEESGKDSLKKKIGECRKHIHTLKSNLSKPPPEFNNREWNQKLSHNDHQRRELAEEEPQLKEKIEELKQKYSEKQGHLTRFIEQITSLESKDGQTLAMLQRAFPDVHSGWQWIQANQDKFKKEVFGPAMLTCSLTDDRYGDVIQSQLGDGDLLAFTCQTPEDHHLVSEEFYGRMKLRVSVRSQFTPLNQFRSPTSPDEIKDMGLDGYAIDYVHGPDPVLAMLCSTARLHLSAVGLSSLSEAQYNHISADKRITSFAAGSLAYKIMRRSEYGDSVISSTRPVRKGRFWTNQPVDTAVKSQLEEQMNECKEAVDQIQKECFEIKKKLQAIHIQKEQLEMEYQDLSNQKRTLQRAYNQHKALPEKIKEKEDELESFVQQMQETRDKMFQFGEEKQKLKLAQVKAVLEYKHTVDRLGELTLDMRIYQLMQIEAYSEVQRHEQMNQGLIDRLEQLQREVEVKKAESKNTRKHAEELLTRLRDYSEADPEAFNTAREAAVNKSLAEIETEAAEVDAQLLLYEDADPSARRRYTARQEQIDQLRSELGESAVEVEKLHEEVAAKRGVFEPAVDKLVETIGTAFEHNFEQISCAGEVGLHKDEEDFDKWAIRIRVRFREGEQLEVLDVHRQSGGERSVTTIFYLMSLQAMAQAPFRVVDEINQGMDPRNERMVHERMVEIACREHTSQYFLITPKLLTGLRYDEGMTILCIANGPKMAPGCEDKMDLAAMIQKKLELKRSRA